MFLQISLKEQYKNAVKFLSIEDDYENNFNIRILKMNPAFETVPSQSEFEVKEFLWPRKK